MKRSDLLRKIRKAAQQAEIAFELVRQGGAHEIYRCGSRQVTVPRHREINEYTAQGTMSDLDDVLGKGWWR
ncbi:MAG: type II toxin-antitoxin system HicA family toxin [Mycobacterium sp.]|nr:type II toxin-antitoxin system HicA family toxin [Mycobacterium sp.]